ncbi:ShlB/FhaC/HecB family hemolysin secretion/activation protein [Caldimonas caldifontis]|nr:ShlB/FhaC/HecB family hemolysin secretion/activation protein [Caldimonas caldifontis]
MMTGWLRVMAGALLSLGTTAWAQEPPETPEGGFKGFAIMGENPLSAGETAALLAPLLRQQPSAQVLEQAAVRLERALHDRGYVHYRVVLPVQAPSDTISLNVLRRTVSRVEFVGVGASVDEAALRAALPELQERASPNAQRLARELAIAQRNPSRQMEVDWVPDAATDTVTARVRVQESRPWSLGASWSNAGTRETGRDRLHVGASHHDVLGGGELLSVAYTTSADRPSRVSQIGVRAEVPFPAWGGVLQAQHFRSDVVGRFGVDRPDRGLAGFDSTGPGHETRLGYAYHVGHRSVGRQSYWQVAIDDKRFEASDLEGQPQATGVRRSRPLSLEYAARSATGVTQWSYEIGFAANVARGEGNDLTAYRTENAEIETTHWKVWRAALDATTEWGEGWQGLARLHAQYSPDLLLAGEAFGLGGIGSIRGVPDRALYGDSGWAATLEGRTPPLWQGLRLLAFIDTGAVYSDLTDSPVRRRKDRLTSVGLGVRYAHANGASLRADYGRVVTGSRADAGANPTAPTQGDDKLHVNVSLAF